MTTYPTDMSITRDRREILRTRLLHPYFGRIPKQVGEFWTARQRQMHSLHYVISYRASYKPELPHFFIGKYSKPGDMVLDPFGGRGTTALEAILMGRYAINADINPLSERIVVPKMNPVPLPEISKRLSEIDFGRSTKLSLDLSMFYHTRTERQLLALKKHLEKHREAVDRFIELIALSRLHGHSAGFFSVYSFPQISVPPEAQRRINSERRQEPEPRDVPALILRKAKKSLRDGRIEAIAEFGSRSKAITADARDLCEIENDSVDLVVTSPPFLNKADYLADNWLEFWFCGIESDAFAGNMVMTPNLDKWKQFLRASMAEIHRILKPGGHAVIEVGEVKNGSELLHLDEVLIDLAAGLCRSGVTLKPVRIMIQQQNFTKLANCFNVDNNLKGTNTNRMVVFVKE